jgi:D-alanine-D-alanine ligase
MAEEPKQTVSHSESAAKPVAHARSEQKPEPKVQKTEPRPEKTESKSEKDAKNEKEAKSEQNSEKEQKHERSEKADKTETKPADAKSEAKNSSGPAKTNGFLHFQSKLRKKDGPLADKTIIMLNSGSKKKEFILRRTAELGVSIALVNRTLTWEKKYVDHFIQADTYNHAEVLEKLKHFIKEFPSDGAITFWEDDVPLLAKVCKKLRLIGPSLDCAEKARNKFAMRKAFEEAGIRTPKYALLNSQADLEKAIKEIGVPAVIKPVWGSDSEFVVKVETEDEARNVYAYEMKNAVPKFNPIFIYNQSNFIYEEYVEGIEVNVESLTQKTMTSVVAITDKLPMKEPFFIERGDLAPTRFESETQARIRDAVVAAIKAVGQKDGVSHTEVKVGKDGLCVIETAARMGGDYLWDWTKQVWNVDLVEQGLRIAFGLPMDFVRAEEPLCYLVGAYFIPEYSGVVSGIRFQKEVSEFSGLDTLFIPKKVGDTILVPPEGFENLGWVVTRGESHIDANRKLEEMQRNVAFNVLQFTPGSSVGQTKLKSFSKEAFASRVAILRGSRVEKIRLLQTENPPPLHIGVLCNLYENEEGKEDAKGDEKREEDARTEERKGEDAKAEEKREEASEYDAVEADLMSVGKNIQKALESKGHQVSFFDMNEYPLPFEKIMNSKVDLVFNVCERINGSSLLEPHAASFLDMLNIPYTGSNPATLALCIDKIRMKKLLSHHNIPTPRWDYAYNPDDEIDETLRYPLILKPANADNSIGITNESVVRNVEELRKQLAKVIGEGHPALIEEYIEGDEYDVSIVGNEDGVQVLPLSRSTFEQLPEGVWHIYPYEAKWGHGDENVYKNIKVERNAKIPQRLAALISEIAIDTYNILDCHDYARIEIRVDKDDNPYVIECNPNPSINDGDAVPGAAEYLGMSYADFIEYVLKLAIQRYKDQPPFHHLTTSSII